MQPLDDKKPRDDKTCKQCLGTGFNYEPLSSNPYCPSCNGTGIRSYGAAQAFWAIVVYCAAFAAAIIWVLYRIFLAKYN